MKRLTDAELDEWLIAYMADPSIVHPREVGYMPDGWHRNDPKRPRSAESSAP